MVYRNLFLILGIVLVAIGLLERGWFLVAVWAGCNFLLLGVAHARGAHRLFGKRSNGTLPLWSRLLFFPLLFSSIVVWHLIRLFSREPAQTVVTNHLVLGRRLLPSEIEGDFDNFVDLTAEFTEPLPIRSLTAYRSFPILDGSAPAPEALRAAVAGLKSGQTYVHCAQGHGRAALFALAVLLSSGSARSIEEGMRMLRAVRPGVRLSIEQQRCIKIYAEGLG